MTNFLKIYVKAYTVLNLGDDLFIYILCNRYPNIMFYIKEHANHTDIFKNIKNLKIIKNIDEIKYDAIVYIGGSIFIENSEESIKRVDKLKKEIIKENINTYIIGANFGPYYQEAYYNKIRNEIFPYMKSVTFRDKYSYNLFKDLNNINYAKDIVFQLDASNIKKIDNNEIGISLIHHLDRKEIKKYYDKYIDKLKEIAKYYIKKGYKIRLFSFCEIEEDTTAINDLLNKMDDSELKYINITKYNGNIEDILNKLANLKMLVATRFHSIILGLKFNIPIIPICYSNKCTNVLNDINFKNIYKMDTLDDIKYKKIPSIHYIDTKDSVNQFKDLDLFINESSLKIYNKML